MRFKLSPTWQLLQFILMPKIVRRSLQNDASVDKETKAFLLSGSGYWFSTIQIDGLSASPWCCSFAPRYVLTHASTPSTTRVLIEILLIQTKLQRTNTHAPLHHATTARGHLSHKIRFTGWQYAKNVSCYLNFFIKHSLVDTTSLVKLNQQCIVNVQNLTSRPVKLFQPKYLSCHSE